MEYRLLNLQVECRSLQHRIELAMIRLNVEILQIKYLKNLVEQDHRFIRKITKPMMGFKAPHSAKATIAGIETAYMI
jgi:putative transposase